MAADRDLKATIETLLSTWNIGDRQKNDRLLADIVTNDIHYADPHSPEAFSGRQAFLEFLEVFHSRVPDVRLVLEGEPESHHGYVRFRFNAKRGDAMFSRGTFFADLAADGRIDRLVGFMDEEPRGR